MNNKTNRPVQFTFHNDVNGGKYHNPPLNGTFHRYVDEPVCKDEKYYAETSALIEDEDGKMYKVPCDKFSFIDKV